MAFKCNDIMKYFEGFAPASLAEEWDNVGLLVGNCDQEIKRIMVCLDVTPAVVEEAIAKEVDLLISHHPVIFKGIKRINENNRTGSVIYKLIKHNINVFCAHTNLDVAEGGLNDYLAGVIGLKDLKNLNKYKTEKLYKIVVFVPEESVDPVRAAMSGAGAGWIGRYSDCFFTTGGIGTFRPLEDTNPYIGAIGKLEKVNEYRLETIVPESCLKSVTESMVKAHPYEEVAYDVYPLELEGKEYGLGKVGVLEQPVSLDNFILLVKERLGIEKLRIIGNANRDLHTIAVFSGSFDDNWSALIQNKVDILVTGDIKYHSAMDARDMNLCVIDAGHFNTERIVVPMLMERLKTSFPDVEVIANTVETDPFNYI